MKVEVSAQTYQVGAHFKALNKAVLVALLKTFEKFFSISRVAEAQCWKFLGSDFWSRNLKSMWKPYAVGISYFIGKKILLLIFQTLFYENWQIHDNFDQNLFLVE